MSAERLVDDLDVLLREMKAQEGLDVCNRRYMKITAPEYNLFIDCVTASVANIAWVE